MSLIRRKLANAIALAQIANAGNAPTIELTRDQLKGAATWTDYAKRVATPVEHRVESWDDEEQNAHIRSHYQVDVTRRIAQPIGIVWMKFTTDLLDIPTQFEERISEAKTEIHLEFNEAPGGDGAVSDKMISILKARGVPVYGKVTRSACSAHCDIFVLGCTHRVMAPAAQLMVHTGQYIWFGPASKVAGHLAANRQADQDRIDLYVRRTGRPRREVESWFDDRDHWFTAPEAVRAGLADQIV